MKHHTADDQECERREDQQGAWNWLRRNLTLPSVLTIIGMLVMLLVAVYGFTSKVQAGADAAVTVKAIERDYVGKKEMENVTTTLHTRINKLESRFDKVDDKIDRLHDVILDRLPDRPTK